MIKRLSLIYYILTLCVAFFLPSYTHAQKRTEASGVVVDAQTGEVLPFVQIVFLTHSADGKSVEQTSVGTTSDLDGKFTISNSAGYTEVNFLMIGYKPYTLTLKQGQTKQGIKVKLNPDVYGLDDIIVKPQKEKKKYKRKGNPAVELAKNVIAHRDSFSVKAADHYTANTYCRMSFALDNFNPDFTKPFWKTFAFAEKYIDTTDTYPSITVSIREHLINEYYQHRPYHEKKIIQTKRIFGLEDIVGTDQLQENINAIFKDPEITDDNMKLLLNRFVSPISSSLATSFYQYYIIDTLIVDGYECIDLAFVPVNSESYAFTGHLYILNDSSTYKIKKYTLNLPQHINLNFVSDYVVEQNYHQLENGLWAPERTSIFAKLFLYNKKRGILARQTKIYTNWDLQTPIDKEIFSSLTPSEALDDSTATRLISSEWEHLRPEPLTRYESSVYDLVQEFTDNPKFASMAMAVNAFATEFVSTTNAKHIDDSKFDFGPIYNFISWNKLEGVRLRLGGTSTALLHNQFFFRGYVAFGTTDLRPKYNATLLYSFNKKKRYAYEPQRNYLQLSAQYDVEEPGQVVDVIARDNIIMSIPTSKPTLKNDQYVFHAKLEYKKDWENGIGIRTVFDYSNSEAAGAMKYERINNFTTDSLIGDVTRIKNYNSYRTTLEFSYSPGKAVCIDRIGVPSGFAIDKDNPVITLQHTLGFLDDRNSGGKGFFINKTDIQFDKRCWLSAFGHIDLRLKMGMVWNQVPFTELYTPETSTSILLAQRSFNQMLPMEFLMDEYVSLVATYYLKGWIINRIPGLNRLKLRGIIGVSALYGGLTKKNNPFLIQNADAGLYQFPNSASFEDKDNYKVLTSGTATSPFGKLPYIEINAGIENIFKFFRIDYIRRITYNDYDLFFEGSGYKRHLGGWGRNGVKLTARFAL
ncbi:MAG: DUF5686 and carboxypeptidase regulatory-like domain-containing protein [Paludibacteraceae bacterium]|nr:DUF5686 and carboxypeptidase regulatory-like domain-containing protein [Paludibacteraceae bacterium]